MARYKVSVVVRLAIKKKKKNASFLILINTCTHTHTHLPIYFPLRERIDRNPSLKFPDENDRCRTFQLSAVH